MTREQERARARRRQQKLDAREAERARQSARNRQVAIVVVAVLAVVGLFVFLSAQLSDDAGEPAAQPSASASATAGSGRCAPAPKTPNKVIPVEKPDKATAAGKTFEAVVTTPGLEHLEAGVVLQAYLPDALPALERLTAVARARVEAGGAPLKVRLVKGANLAMEKVDAELHDWEQAPFTTKEDVDAGYVRLLDVALTAGRTRWLRVGVASHNLPDVALAVEVARARGARMEAPLSAAPDGARPRCGSPRDSRCRADVPSPRSRGPSRRSRDSRR